MSIVPFALSRFLGRRTLIGLAVLLILALLHGVILRMLAWPLQAGDSSAGCDCFCIHGGELGADGFEPFDLAAEWQAEAAGRKILLLLPQTSRIVEVGAVPSFEQMCRRQLTKRGVPAADVWSIRAEARDAWEEAHALGGWLKAHPASTVRITCSPFGSGLLRYVFNKVLDPAEAARVRLAVLADPNCRIESWWRSREGVKGFMYSWLELIYTWAKGEEACPATEGAAAFQQELRGRIGEAAP
jgi:hypothetical protein